MRHNRPTNLFRYPADVSQQITLLDFTKQTPRCGDGVDVELACGETGSGLVEALGLSHLETGPHELLVQFWVGVLVLMVRVDQFGLL